MNDVTVTLTIKVALPKYVLISDVDAFKVKLRDELERHMFDILNDENMIDPDISENTEAEVIVTDRWEQEFAAQQAGLKARTAHPSPDTLADVLSGELEIQRLTKKAAYTYRGEECDLCGKLTQVLSNDPDASLVCCDCQMEGARS